MTEGRAESGSPQLCIPPSLASAVQVDGLRIYSELADAPRQREPDRTSASEIPVVAEITPEMILEEGDAWETDYAGRITAGFYEHDGRRFTIRDEQYRAIRDIALKLLGSGKVAELLSPQFVEHAIFRWVRDRHRENLTTPLVAYLEARAGEAVRDYEYWIPVSHFSVESEFSFGPGWIRPLRATDFDRWCENSPAPTDEGRAQYAALLAKFRRKLQGRAVVVWRCRAEQRRAEYLAHDGARRAIDLLRFFSAPMFFLNVNSGTAVLGLEALATATYLRIEDGILVGDGGAYIGGPFRSWKLLSADLERLRPAGLEALSRIFGDPGRTPFESLLMSCLEAYSLTSLEGHPPARLAQLFVPLERLLVRGQDERIQSSVSERIAFFVGRSKDQRKEIVRQVKDAYNRRSRYVHQGAPIGEAESIQPFLKSVWTFLSTTLLHTHRFRTKDDFISEIEDIKFGGGLDA